MTWALNAHHQWATRPADERFADLASLHAHVHGQFTRSSELESIRPGTLADALTVAGGEPALELPLLGQRPLTFTNYGMQSLCDALASLEGGGRPSPKLLASIQPETSVAVLKDCLWRRELEDSRQPLSLLLEQNGSDHVRAVRTTRYSRLWNHEITSRLLEAVHGTGWTNPRAYVCRPGSQTGFLAADLHRTEPSGLFAGDRDMFILLQDETRPLDDGSGHPVFRGVMIQNSEVGAAGFNLWAFLYRMICGNLMVHGGRLLASINIRHIGATTVARAIGETTTRMRQLTESSAHPWEEAIRKAQTVRLGDDDLEVVETVGARRFGKLPVKTAEKALELCKSEEPDLDPLTAYGFVQGLTALARTQPNRDLALINERRAGKIIDVVAQA